MNRLVQPKERARWEVERERFQLPPEPPATHCRIHTPAHVLPRMLKKSGLEDIAWEQQLTAQWGELLGDQVARNTRPGRLERTTLIVYVTHSAWLMELRGYGEKTMLQKLQSRFGARHIRGIRLLLDPDAQGRM